MSAKPHGHYYAPGAVIKLVPGVAKQVAKQLGLSTRKVYELHASGRLAGYRFGRAVRFDVADVERLEASSRTVVSQRVTAGSLRLVAIKAHAQLPGEEPELQRSFRRLGLVPKPPGERT